MHNETVTNGRATRGKRAFSELEEWGIYYLVTSRGFTPETIAVGRGCTSRTIENVLQRRRLMVADALVGEQTEATAA